MERSLAGSERSGAQERAAKRPSSAEQTKRGINALKEAYYTQIIQDSHKGSLS